MAGIIYTLDGKEVFEPTAELECEFKKGTYFETSHYHVIIIDHDDISDTYRVKIRKTLKCERREKKERDEMKKNRNKKTSLESIEVTGEGKGGKKRKLPIKKKKISKKNKLEIINPNQNSISNDQENLNVIEIPEKLCPFPNEDPVAIKNKIAVIEADADI